MRKEHQVRLGRFDDLLQRQAIAVGRVVLQQVMLHEQNFRDILRREFVRERRHAFADHGRADRARRRRGDLLRRHQRLEAGVVPLALPLLGNDEYFHGQITRASNFSFSTNLAATSFGVPVRNSVFLVFVGT